MALPRFSSLRRLVVALTIPLSIALAAAGETSVSPDAIAIAVVFDTSGSMRDPIETKRGAQPDAKFRVAQRAFYAVINRLEAFSKQSGAKPLAVGVYTFQRDKAAVTLPLAAFNATHLRACVNTMRADGSTPLGETIALAGRDLLAQPAASRHLLVLTDGANSAGRKPEQTLALLQADALRQQAPVFTHVIALDINPAIFDALKKQGATLIGAANEPQLNAQFDFILEEKILVEAPR